jgi:sodium-dependent dicarboxylate transporter 2/3/5
MGEAPRYRDLPQVREQLSERELRFERARRTVGLFAGPLVCAALLAFPLPGLAQPAARLVAVMALALVWWVSEAVPIPVTSLVAPALAVLCGVGSAAEIFAPFGDPIVFLFLGSFVLAEAMSASGLDRRIAWAVLARPGVRTSPLRTLLGFAAITAGLSAWLNNTATAAMLYPIALGALAALARGSAAGPLEPTRLRFGTSLMLTVAYAASIGGIATPVGTAPNLIALGQLEKLSDARIPFLHWMLLATPVALVMLSLWLAYARFALPPEPSLGAPARGEPAGASQGPLSRRERNVLAAFGATIALWVLPGAVALALGPTAPAALELERLLPEGAVALLGAALLFLLPVDWRERRMTLSWHEAARIDWGTLLLFGGGLALGGAMFRTGLAASLGSALVELTGSGSLVALTYLFAGVALVMTETTSNTATVTMVAPLAIAAAQAAGVSPVPPLVAVALCSSMAFMLPVSTPPNAIVYSSGCVPITAMLRHGAALDLASLAVVPTLVLALCGLLGLG